MRPDWNATRQGPQYIEDPARGTVSPLWGAAVPEWGWDGFDSASKHGVNWCDVCAWRRERGLPILTANSGTVAVFHAWATWRASFLALGEPFGAGGCVAGGFGGG